MLGAGQRTATGPAPTVTTTIPPMAIEKLLVANRGEIALRVFRTCAAEGIGTVAVVAPDDTGSLHAREADETVTIASYLDASEHVRAAREAGADAVHPGYGFLAESADFAEAVAGAGLLWVGPPAAALRLGGDKIAAKQAAIAAGVPVVRDGEPEEIGYPLLVKAAAGGGGRGMRVVRSPEGLEEALAAAAREAKAAFGDGTVFCERYVERPRHVEIQLLADTHGTVLSLGERECSVQRRHQKVLEESPSPALDPALRTRMSAAAIAFARAIGYVGAGTAEFMVSDGEFWFLELNGRIQVEHPVTELVTGVDLVQWQLRIAAGEKLPFAQQDIRPRGWAMECRITSEDPANSFLPSTGRVRFLHVPSGPGVRWDSGIETGSEISLHYDPMLAKLIVWAPTRIEAIGRMHRALLELTIEGVDTSRDFHLRMMENDDFRRGAIDIQWLEQHLPALSSVAPPRTSVIRAAIAAVLLAERDRSAPQRATATATTGAASAATSDGVSAWSRAGRLDAMR